MDDNIKVSTSVIDYVFRVLGLEYLNRTDLAHVIEEAPTGQLAPKPHATDVPVGREHRLPRVTSNGGEVKLQAAPRMQKAAAENADDMGGNAAVIQAKRMLGDAPACTICGHHHPQRHLLQSA